MKQKDGVECYVSESIGYISRKLSVDSVNSFHMTEIHLHLKIKPSHFYGSILLPIW